MIPRAASSRLETFRQSAAYEVAAPRFTSQGGNVTCDISGAGSRRLLPGETHGAVGLSGSCSPEDRVPPSLMKALRHGLEMLRAERYKLRQQPRNTTTQSK